MAGISVTLWFMPPSNRVPSRAATSRWLAMLGVAAAALAALIPAGPAPAAMAGHHAPQTAAGTLSTAAGGPGGPGPATKIAIGPTGVAYGHGDLYIADGYVQEIGRASCRERV